FLHLFPLLYFLLSLHYALPISPSFARLRAWIFTLTLSKRSEPCPLPLAKVLLPWPSRATRLALPWALEHFWYAEMPNQLRYCTVAARNARFAPVQPPMPLLQRLLPLQLRRTPT